ncbi:helix-turn-helix domain-containing protein [Clostridiaceae bacterium OttesenSCG-928-D20]|nr:helix-turn-helix domain-containing protein [Clostridiaceae bacterium OttesenSCG-928-D20]
MNNQKSNIAENLRHLRAANKLSLEAVAEKVGVSRQAVAKWKNGDSLPDILNCESLAELFGVSLSDLVKHDTKKAGMPIGLNGKYIFGTVTVGERGQLVLPKKTREVFNISHGDTLVVLGDTNPATEGIALVASATFLRMTGHAIEGFLGGEDK